MCRVDERVVDALYKHNFCVILVLFINIFCSAVKRLIAINQIQNKRFCLNNICMCTVFIYYVYINTHAYSIYCVYIYMYMHLYIYVIIFYSIYKYI